MNAAQQLLTEHLDIWTAADTEKKSGRGRSAGNAANVYGINQLRGLILGLAVGGKLLAQENKWRNLKLSDLGFWAIGSGFPTSEQGSQNDEILFVKVSDMNLAGNEKFIISANNTITTDTAKRIKINVHSAGTVIFPKIGGAIATNKRRILTRETAIDNNCLGLTPKPGVSTDWLYLLLSSIDLSKYQAGTSVPALAQGVLQDIPVLLPDETEQLKIVAKVDELMALCDQLETQHNNATEAHEKLVSHLLGTLTQSQSAADFSVNWQRIGAHFDTLFTTEASIDALKQTLLQLAVMGKLVPQDPNDEPASELLKRIQAEKSKLVAEGKLKKDKLLPQITEDEKQFELPENWEWVRFDVVANTRLGKMLDKVKNKGGSRPYLRNTNVQWFVFELNDLKEMRFEERELDEYRVIAGDLVICEGGEPGRCAIWKGQIDEMFIQKALHRARPWAGVLPEFLQFCFKVDASNGYLSQFFTGATIKHFSGEKLSGYPVPLPPTSEQHRIVEKVDELMALCDQLKSRITSAIQLQQKLADVMVEQAVA
jgi:type I restriction enzyme S subunit